ncbi:MAG: hypothetical protein C0501_04785 [Isosphaera sp.]|nr:hypothetical protein [Isosphaera sp.]
MPAPGREARWHAVWLPARTDAPRAAARAADVVGLPSVTARAGPRRRSGRGPGSETAGGGATQARSAAAGGAPA